MHIHKLYIANIIPRKSKPLNISYTLCDEMHTGCCVLELKCADHEQNHSSGRVRWMIARLIWSEDQSRSRLIKGAICAVTLLGSSLGPFLSSPLQFQRSTDCDGPDCTFDHTQSRLTVMYINTTSTTCTAEQAAVRSFLGTLECMLLVHVSKYASTPRKNATSTSCSR